MASRGLKFGVFVIVALLSSSCAGTIARRMVMAPNTVSWELSKQQEVRDIGRHRELREERDREWERRRFETQHPERIFHLPAPTNGKIDVLVSLIAGENLGCTIVDPIYSHEVDAWMQSVGPAVTAHPSPWPWVHRPPLATVVLIHGLWGSGWHLWYHARALTLAGYRCIMLDLPGHGRSSPRRITFGIDESQAVVTALRRLRADGHLIGPCLLYGISLGGSVALMAAARDADSAQPVIDGVIAVAPFASVRQAAMGCVTLVPGWSWLLTPELAMNVVDRMEEELRVDLDQESPVTWASRVRVPVLLLHGMDDRLIAPAQSAQLAQRVGGRCRRVLLPEADHDGACLDAGATMPIALPWLRDGCVPGAYALVGPGLCGWQGADVPGLRATWAWRSSDSGSTQTWPRPAGGRRVRTWVSVPAALAFTATRLHLGAISCADVASIDGVFMGRTPASTNEFAVTQRQYVVPRWLAWGTRELTITLETTEAMQGISWPCGSVGVLH